MKRLILGLLLLVLAALLVPPLRERMQPQLDVGRHWLGERLEGPLSPAITWYRRAKTRSQLDKTLTELVTRRNMGFQLPEQHELPELLIQREISPDGLDAWGGQFLLQQRRDTLDIVSAGPDREYETEDDMIASLRYTPRPPPGARR